MPWHAILKIMHKIPPEPRYGTRETVDDLSSKLNLRFEEWMQDWPYEVANADDIDDYINYYRLTADDDRKFLLMQAIVQATTDQREQTDFQKYWSIIEPLLRQDFKLHEYTVFYWSCFDTEDLDDCWIIASNMRQLWNEFN